LTPDAVLAWIRHIGGAPERVIVVGCEPATVEESMGLSESVSSAVDRAIELIRDLVVQISVDAAPDGADRDRKGATPCA